MAGIVRTTVRVAVIGSLVAGAALIIVKPHRLHALGHQIQTTINDKIDRNIDDPVAMRQQLRDLQAQYPERIAQVRADLGEVREQIAELERERAISQRVVDLTDADLSRMQDLIAQAENARVENTSAVITIAYEPGRNLHLDEAYAKATRISETHSVYRDRLADLEVDLSYLHDQESQLTDLSAQLETERAEFQAQLWQLDRQIDAIARNERMIQMMERRQKTLDRAARYEGISLDHVKSQLASKREEQRARLDSMGRKDYEATVEDRARLEIERSADARGFIPEVTIEPRKIIVGDDD